MQVKSNFRKQWSICASQRACTVPVLSHNGITATSDACKANMLNEFFEQCFNTSVPPLVPSASNVSSHNVCPQELLCSRSEVLELLQSLDTSKASGPDGISARMLKSISQKRHRVPPPVFTISNVQLEEVKSFEYLGLLLWRACPGQHTSHQYVLKQNKFWECSADNSTSSCNRVLFLSFIHPWLDHILSMPPLFGTLSYKSKDIMMLESVAVKCAQNNGTLMINYFSFLTFQY